ncbi:hypothetical protein ACQP00_35030 [Dactylosporangium sp. CS-047395]|uniref:hypothetical protein n=1 Tax=Dactylosporangium sp. CS-047395 TaxID=3239936 RepID=UPI003D8F9B1E
MPANRMQRHAAQRALRRHANHHLEAGSGDRAEAPALLGTAGERVDPAGLLDRRGERLWLLTAPGPAGPRPLPWLLRAAWRRAAADPAAAQWPVHVDLAKLAAEGPVTSDVVLAAITEHAATEHGYLVLLDGLDDAGGAVRAAVAGLPGPLERAAPASTVITLSHAEPVPGFHIPAVVLPAAPDPTAAGKGGWDTLADRLKSQRPWPAGLLSEAVDAARTATEEQRWRIIDDLSALPDRRLLFRAALAAGACDDDGVRRAARIEIEALAGTAPAARDARWLSRLLTLLPLLDAGGHSEDPERPIPAADDVLRRMAATGGPGSAPLTLLARRDAEAAVAAAEATGDPLDLEAVARAADEPPVLHAILARCADDPAWPTALVHRAQLDRGVATALLAGRDHDTTTLAGRWLAFRTTRGTAYGRLLDDVLTRPWTWPPHTAPLLAGLERVRPPATEAPITLVALPGAAAGAIAAALVVLALGRLGADHVTPAAATLAVLAGLAVAGAVLARRLRQWHSALPGAGETPAPVRRENVLAGVLNLAGRRLEPVLPGRYTLDDPLRRACIRAGVPETEIAHLLRALAVRHALLGDTTPMVPEQTPHLDAQRERQG